MAQLTRFDVAEYRGVAMVVIPLLSDYPAVKHLNPVITVED